MKKSLIILLCLPVSNLCLAQNGGQKPTEATKQTVQNIQGLPAAKLKKIEADS
jgi:hypothetical protein